ncbi:DUF6338 family protein [Mucilaginibacter sp. RB4R14]|uniref:DUF6338 family protein n=1 Tax=Mucilaginibacter aurantiaciroseus TaxID=2949308 RepID=UPI0020914329|nr:DUF6338 family protein [Mucilaginibacter aurantiaciroseus]MCO5937224.1 DUF6338 family protein [Mucilaginibacter aurantiaciroseus]
MSLLTDNNIALFIVLFLPGFISVKIHRLLVADEKYDFTKNLFEIVGYSLMNFILFSWLLFINFKYSWHQIFPTGFFLSIFVVFIVGPFFWPLILNRILRSEIIKPYVISSSKSAWDFHFTKRKASWIIVHLKDGRKIGGKFGSKSFAAPYPCKETIYIEELWKLESDRFINIIPQTAGILIISDDIFAIEFFT